LFPVNNKIYYYAKQTSLFQIFLFPDHFRKGEERAGQTVDAHRRNQTQLEPAKELGRRKKTETKVAAARKFDEKGRRKTCRPIETYPTFNDARRRRRIDVQRVSKRLRVQLHLLRHFSQAAVSLK
jgi:hypothetical protein